ncbi:MAG: LapA family protein [Desulfatiglans sp.]|jgi:hypothetical protein|nr:LapA family protein [Thermodesulfobacteriota bacterium]MEE4353206.1 LapA family protein [Desulfatiglans sp.]
MKQLRWIGVILLALLVIIIVVQNHGAMSTPVMFKLDLVFISFESSQMSVYQVAVITFLLGVLVSGVYGMTERFRLKRQVKNLLKESSEKDKELSSFRNLPVTTDDESIEKAMDSQ